MTAKVTDLQKDTHVPSSKTGLTTDHGVFVSDTDNWCVKYAMIGILF